jgi:hypothetical protein
MVTAITVATVFGVFGAGCAFAFADNADNLVKNPSFEEKAENGAMPSHWGGNSEVYGLDTTVHHSGNVSLRYQNADSKRYVLCSQRMPVKPGWLVHFSAWVKTQDVVGEDSGATICLEWNDGAKKWLGGVYPAGIKGTHDWKLIEGEARVPEKAGSVVLACYVRQHMTGTAWFDDVTLVRAKPKLLDTMLLTPNYRSRITAEGPKEILVRANLNLGDYELTPRDVRLAIALRDGEKKELFGRKNIEIPESPNATTSSDVTKVELALPIGDLAPNLYDLEVQAIAADGKILGTSHHSLERVAADFKPHCAIDSHRRLLVDGQPFFPIGMYWHAINAKDIEIFADSRFNCLMPYGSPTKEQMDLAWQHHLRVLYSVKDCFFGIGSCPKSIHNEKEEEEWVRSRFKAFREHPALLGWYLNDELPQTYLPRLNAHQQWAMEEDPQHPTWVVLCHPSTVGDYCNSFDVIGTDPYPIGHTPASTAAHWTTETMEQTQQRRAVWQVPQIFNWANYEKNEEAKKKLRTPTIDEIRSMAWQCITEGATGLVFYSWFDLKRNPDVPFETLWPEIKEMAAEVDRAAPVLLSIETSPKVTVAQTNASEPPAWLHFTVRRHDGKLYLFAVNDGDGEGRVRFHWDVPIHRVHEIRTNRSLDATDATFEDDFGKLQVSIYEID